MLAVSYKNIFNGALWTKFKGPQNLNYISNVKKNVFSPVPLSFDSHVRERCKPCAHSSRLL